MSAAPLNVKAVREAFPALHQEVRGRPLVYLDNAATTLKPQQVIDAVTSVYAKDCANVHRGVHVLSQRATERFEGARETVRRHINAKSSREVIFVRGTTEAINLVANSLGSIRLGPGKEILVTGLEHHSNIVPWQLAAQRTGATLKVVPITDAGEVELGAFEAALSDKTAIVAIAHVSNALGTVLPVKELVQLAKARGATVLVDGAQALPHQAVDVQDLGCDLYAFSGHKVYGPTGIGVLWGREALLEEMPPWQGGGDMILSVSFEKTLYNELPYKFEAGTPHIAGAVGLGAALQWLEGIGLDAVAAHEADLLAYGTERLQELGGVRIVGTAARKAGVLSFLMEGVHPHDVGTIVDSTGVALRTGHHCAQPVMERFGIPATSRASLGIYNDRDDIERLVEALGKVREVFG